MSNKLDDLPPQPSPGEDNTASVKAGGPAASLSARFKQRTLSLHTRAERSGIVRELLRGRVSRYGYALLLRNLLPAYSEMEKALERNCLSPIFRGLTHPGLYRTRAIEADLAALYGPDWADGLPLLAAGRTYGRRIATAAKGDGSRLIAHAYARYLGDLNGGQILKRLLGKSPGLPPEALSFYDFPGIDDLDGFKIAYRHALDDAAFAIADVGPVIEEAATAFELNIAVSEAAQQAADKILTAYGAAET